MAVEWLDPKANLETMSRAFDEVASMGGADLVVFPELVYQGYVKPSTDDDYKDFALAYRGAPRRYPAPSPARWARWPRRNGCYVVAAWPRPTPP